MTTDLSDPTSGATTDLANVAGKHLTFQLGKEVYGLEILKVQEIIGVTDVTPIPRTPPSVRGVINLRGKVIPVVDLRRKFDLEAKEDTDRTCIIVVEISGEAALLTIGILVDEVCEVQEINADQIEAPPSFGASVNTDFMLGMGKIGDVVVSLLNIDKVLSGQELGAVTQTAVSP
jgi:purine-binding chemotaxis protein CheW